MFTYKKGDIDRKKEELLEKKRRLLIKARIAVEWEKEDLLSKFEEEIKALNDELNKLKWIIENWRE